MAANNSPSHADPDIPILKEAKAELQSPGKPLGHNCCKQAMSYVIRVCALPANLALSQMSDSPALHWWAPIK